MKGRHLISVDELRAAGALDVPPGWRKSLSAGNPKGNTERLLWDETESPAAQEQPAPDTEADSDESAEGDE